MTVNIPNRARRRTLLTGLLAGAWCLASGLLPAGPTAAVAAEPTIGSVAVLGDSYSVTSRSGVKGWVQQLVDRNAVSVEVNLARDGALASSASGPLSLLGQVDAYLARSRRADFTIVYFGTDDLAGLKSLTAVRTNYQRAVDRLVAGGTTAGTRRLVLVQIHDVSRNPAVTTNERAKVTSLNSLIKSLVSSRPNVLTVNLGSFFDRVFANPSQFNLTNVTTAEPARSATTALYFDDNHFGKRGQQLIANEVQKVLSRSRQ